MDIATLIGICGGLGVLVLAVVLDGANLMMYSSTEGVMVVLCGALITCLTRFTLAGYIDALVGGIKSALFFHNTTPMSVLDELTELAELVRKNGPLGLEKAEIRHEFLKKAMQMIADGYSGEVIQRVLERERDLNHERLESSKMLFAKLNEAGPGMGMVGTIIGLVSLFAHMDDPKKIGPAMSVALLTTLYGAIISNVIAGPLSDKLGFRATEEGTIETLIIDGAMLIRENKSPQQVYDQLVSYLPLHKRKQEEKAAA